MKKPDNDDFIEFDREFKTGQQAGRQEAVSHPVLHRQPSGQRSGRDDRAGPVPQAQPLQARPGAGLHSQPVRHRRLHVPHGLDPFTKQPVYIAKHLRDRKLQRALLQFFKPENYFEVRRALEQAGRQDLIGNGCDCLIPATPPKAALDSAASAPTNRFANKPPAITSAAGQGKTTASAIGQEGTSNRSVRSASRNELELADA